MNPIDAPTYDYLASLVDAATRHHDECDKDLLDCDCGAETDGGDLVEVMFAELRRLRGEQP